MRGRHPQTLVLQEEHVEILERNLRAGTTEYRVARRSQILLWRGTGVRPTEVSRRLGCGRNTVWRLEERYRAEGVEALQDRPRPGHPCKISPPPDCSNRCFGLPQTSGTGAASGPMERTYARRPVGG